MFSDTVKRDDPKKNQMNICAHSCPPEKKKSGPLHGGCVERRSSCYNVAQFDGDGAILVIGHEPALSGLIGKVISQDGTASLNLAKGDLAKIGNFSFDKQPSGVLQWLLTAKQIQAMQ